MSGTTGMDSPSILKKICLFSKKDFSSDTRTLFFKDVQIKTVNSYKHLDLILDKKNWLG